MFGKPQVPKQKYSIPKKSARKIKEEQAMKDENGDTELQKWYRARMKVMGDRCNLCGCKVETKIYQYAIVSICHILPKRDNCCPSVKTHPLNFITLCVDHHHQFDNITWEERETWGCWETIKERLIMMYDCLDKGELRHFPESVKKYIEQNDVFPK